MPSIPCLLARIGLALSLVLTPISAQGNVLTVDDDPASMPDFTDLDAAISAATEGDIIFVREGTYSRLVIDGKSVTIQAEEGAAVHVQPPCCARNLVRNLGPSQSVRIRGLKLMSWGPGLTLEFNSGVVWIEDCEIGTIGDSAGPGIFVDGSADVILIRTSATGFSVPNDCSTDWFEPAGAGLGCRRTVAGTSSIHAFGSTFRGGNGGWANYFFLSCESLDGAPGIQGSDPLAFLFLSDCTVIGGDADFGCFYDSFGFCRGTHPGDGLSWTGIASILDSRLSGGTIPPQTCGFGSPCDYPASPGQPVSALGTIRFMPGEALRMRVTSPVRENGSVEAVFEGPPFTAVFLQGHPRPAPLFASALSGTTLVPWQAQVRFVGITDASGRLVHSTRLPTLLPGNEGSVAFGQAFYLDVNGPPGVPVGRTRQAPVRFVLGEGSMLVGLDESL